MSGTRAAVLLVLASRSGDVWALQTSTPGFGREMAREFVRGSLAKQEAKDWWFGGGHLYEVWIQPIYFGISSENTALGFLVLGHEIDKRAAADFSNIAASEVAFYAGDTLVATALPASEQSELTRRLHGSALSSGSGSKEIKLGSERYLETTVGLSADGGPSVSLNVLKSLDKATLFLSELNRVLLGLGLLSVLAGSFLVFLISHTFTRPLANLVAGVRALEQGDFSYPLEHRGGDEVAEVTGAFDRMRTSSIKPKMTRSNWKRNFARPTRWRLSEDSRVESRMISITCSPSSAGTAIFCSTESARSILIATASSRFRKPRVALFP